jgi:hypothetical protein
MVSSTSKPLGCPVATALAVKSVSLLGTLPNTAQPSLQVLPLLFFLLMQFYPGNSHYYRSKHAAGIKLHEKEKQQRQNLKRWLSCVG